MAVFTSSPEPDIGAHSCINRDPSGLKQTVSPARPVVEDLYITSGQFSYPELAALSLTHLNHRPRTSCDRHPLDTCLTAMCRYTTSCQECETEIVTVGEPLCAWGCNNMVGHLDHESVRKKRSGLKHNHGYDIICKKWKLKAKLKAKLKTKGQGKSLCHPVVSLPNRCTIVLIKG